jgi:hypothetical protein
MGKSKYNKEYYRKYYKKNKQKKLAAVKAYRAANPDKVKAWLEHDRPQKNQRQNIAKKRRIELINAILLHYRCQNDTCASKGGTYYACELEFHHIDPLQKKFNISQMHRENKSKVAAEINKCIVLCSNCHRRYHAGIISIDNAVQCNVSNKLLPAQF